MMNSRWYSETVVERRQVRWRCAICQVTEARIVDFGPDGYDSSTFEHEWRSLTTEGPVVCSRACADVYTTQLVRKAYGRAAVEVTE